MAIRGHIDQLTTGTAAGWAFDDSDADAPLEIEIVLGDRVIASGAANRYRQDLAAAGLGGGRCAFELSFAPLTEEELLGLEIKPARGELVFEKPKTDLLQLVVRGALSRYPGAARYRSLFGGLWTDRTDAEEVVRGRFELGQIDDSEVELLLRWIRDGHVVLRGALSHELLDRVAEDAASAGGGREGPEGGGAALVDFHAGSRAAREAVFAPAIYGFLAQVFARPPLAFRQILANLPAGEPLHQDSAFVQVSSPLELVTSWIPLENLGPGEGDIELYAGSHRLPEFLFEGRHKWMPPGSPERSAYFTAIHEGAARLGLARRRLALGRGDAVVFAADLAYGIGRSAGRDALLTHYCPSNVKPMYSYGAGLANHGRHDSGGYFCAEARDD